MCIVCICIFTFHNFYFKSLYYFKWYLFISMFCFVFYKRASSFSWIVPFPASRGAQSQLSGASFLSLLDNHCDRTRSVWNTHVDSQTPQKISTFYLSLCCARACVCMRERECVFVCVLPPLVGAAVRLRWVKSAAAQMYEKLLVDAPFFIVRKCACARVEKVQQYSWHYLHWSQLQ